MGQASAGVPDFSIVVPVVREEVTIPLLLDHLSSLDDGRRCEVIVVDGDPAGGTTKSIRGRGVRTLISRPWRSRQMNAGAAAARGRTLIFLHADTLLPATAFDDIDGALGDGRAVGGAFRLRFDRGGPWYRLMASFVTLRARCRRLPYGDQAIFFLRDRFEEIGGYREIPVMEDVEFVRRVRKRGYRMVIVASSVVTSARRLEAEGVFRRVLLNWMISILYACGVAPEKLARFYKEDYRR